MGRRVTVGLGQDPALENKLGGPGVIHVVRILERVGQDDVGLMLPELLDQGVPQLRCDVQGIVARVQEPHLRSQDFRGPFGLGSANALDLFQRLALFPEPG